VLRNHARDCQAMQHALPLIHVRRVGITSKGKVHPRTGDEGPEGEQWESSTLSSTSVPDGGLV
jgi:hypothetical protein